jgi:hypothetical protein
VPLGVEFRRHRDEKVTILKLSDSDHP